VAAAIAASQINSNPRPNIFMTVLILFSARQIGFLKDLLRLQDKEFPAVRNRLQMSADS
jgi:hypothetical protein